MALIIVLAVMVFYIACMWKIFEKAGKPGWAAIVPIYNIMVMAEIAEKPNWWGLLTLIPYVGFIWNIWILNRMIHRFGKSTGFTVATIFFGFITIPILAFGSAEYKAIDAVASGNEDVLDA